MSIGTILSKVLGGSTANVVESVGNVVDKFVTTKEEKAEIQAAITAELNRHNEAVAAQVLAETQAYLSDVDSARNREIEVIKAGRKDITPSVLAYVGTGGFIALVLYILIFGLKSMSGEQGLLVGSLLGVLGSNSTTVYSYYFGSSKGSADKQAKMHEQMEKAITGKE